MWGLTLWNVRGALRVGMAGEKGQVSLRLGLIMVVKPREPVLKLCLLFTYDKQAIFIKIACIFRITW